MNRFRYAKYFIMKNIILYLSEKAKVLFALLLILTGINAYSQTCDVTLRNDSLIDANNLIVDIYVKATSGTFYYSWGQYKISFNGSALLNGGTITGSIVPGYSDLTNSSQLPASIIVAPTPTSWRATSGSIPTDQVLCSQISATGYGTRICRVKLTNTATFAQDAANMLMVTSAPNATAVYYSDAGGYSITATATMVNTNLDNPVLNGTITAYNVTGSGPTPQTIGLDGSQTGVEYQLYKNSVAQGSPVIGTGSALSFGSQTEGTYTVKAHRIATYMISDMTGSAVVTPPAPTAFSVTGTGSYCAGSGGIPVGLSDSETGVTYTLYKGAAPQVPTVAGTGDAITFGNQLAGTYTVTGNNSGGTTTMNGSAVITETALVPVSVSISASANPVCAGTSVTFTATPTNGGTTPTYQWKVDGVNSGTNSSTFTYIPADDDVVTCVLTSNITCPSGNPATSNAITMNVNANLPVSVSISASANPICAGTSVTFTATPANGGTTPSYQWKVDGVNSGTNSSTFTYTPDNADVVTCVLTSSEVCKTGSPATSNSITMTVNSNLPVSVSISPCNIS